MDGFLDPDSLIEHCGGGELVAFFDGDHAAVILGCLRSFVNGGPVVIIVTHDPWAMNQYDRRKELAPHDKN